MHCTRERCKFLINVAGWTSQAKWHYRSMFFYDAATSVLSHELLHKVMNSSAVFIAYIYACWTSRLSQEILTDRLVQCILYNISCAQEKGACTQDEILPQVWSSYIAAATNADQLKWHQICISSASSKTHLRRSLSPLGQYPVNTLSEPFPSP